MKTTWWRCSKPFFCQLKKNCQKNINCHCTFSSSIVIKLFFSMSKISKYICLQWFNFRKLWREKYKNWSHYVISLKFKEPIKEVVYIYCQNSINYCYYYQSGFWKMGRCKLWWLIFVMKWCFFSMCTLYLNANGN